MKRPDTDVLERATGRIEQQAVLRKMALAFADSTGRGLLHLYEVIQMLLVQVGEEPLKQAWGVAYREKRERLEGLGNTTANLNFFLSQLDNSRLQREEEPTSPNFIRYRKMYSSTIKETGLLYDAFHHLLKATEVTQHLTIPNDYWAAAIDPRKASKEMDEEDRA